MNPYCPIVEQKTATSAYEKILYQQLHDQWIKVTYHLKYTRYGRFIRNKTIDTAIIHYTLYL